MPVSLTTASTVLDGIILAQLLNGTRVSRSLLVGTLVFSIMAGLMNGVLLYASLQSHLAGFAAAEAGLLALNVGSLVLTGFGFSNRVPVVLTPTVTPGGGAGAALAFAW